MGAFREDIYVSSGNGGPGMQVSVLVDTGATFTVLPASLVREGLGINANRQENFTLADGSRRVLPVGDAQFAVAGKQAFSPVVLGAEDRYLLGATTLQSLGLIADTTNHQLIPAPELYL